MNEKPSMSFRLAFLLYVNRSGSTYLSTLLDGKAGICVTQELGYVARILESGRGDAIEAGEMSDLPRDIATEPQFMDTGISMGAVKNVLYPGQPRRAAIEAITGLYLQQCVPGVKEARLVVVKGPRLMFHVGRLQQLFPEASFIHVVRDVRGVYASQRNNERIDGRRMADSLLACGQDWRRKVVRILGDSRVHHVRYEDLLSDAEGSLRTLVAELSPGSPDLAAGVLATPSTSYVGRIGQSQKHLHGNTGRSPLVSRAEAWRGEISEVEASALALLCKEALSAYGYGMTRYPFGVRMAALTLLAWDAIVTLRQRIFNVLWRLKSGESPAQIIRRKMLEYR